MNGWRKKLSLGLVRAIPLVLVLSLAVGCAADPFVLDPRYLELRIVGNLPSTVLVLQDRSGTRNLASLPDRCGGIGSCRGTGGGPWRPYPGPSWCLRLHGPLQSVGGVELDVKSCTPVVSPAGE